MFEAINIHSFINSFIRIIIHSFIPIIIFRNGERLMYEGSIENEMAVLKFATDLENLKVPGANNTNKLKKLKKIFCRFKINKKQKIRYLNITIYF